MAPNLPLAEHARAVRSAELATKCKNGGCKKKRGQKKNKMNKKRGGKGLNGKKCKNGKCKNAKKGKNGQKKKNKKGNNKRRKGLKRKNKGKNGKKQRKQKNGNGLKGKINKENGTEEGTPTVSETCFNNALLFMKKLNEKVINFENQKKRNERFVVE